MNQIMVFTRIGSKVMTICLKTFGSKGMTKMKDLLFGLRSLKKKNKTKNKKILRNTDFRQSPKRYKTFVYPNEQLLHKSGVRRYRADSH